MIGPGPRTLLFVLTVHGLLLLGFPSALAFSGLSFFPMPAFQGYRIAAVLIAAAGAAVYTACVWDFVFIGRGTPAAWDPPKHFIHTGPYTVTRNPMYAGMFALVAAEALLWRSSALVAYLAVLALSLHAFVVVLEEPALRRKFGTPYREYCRRVPRWFPRFTHSPQK